MNDSRSAMLRQPKAFAREPIQALSFVSQLRDDDLAIGSERNVMVARNSSSKDLRVELITRIIGDHRNAPNLWLARRIVQELHEFDARNRAICC